MLPPGLCAWGGDILLQTPPRQPGRLGWLPDAPQPLASWPTRDGRPCGGDSKTLYEAEVLGLCDKERPRGRPTCAGRNPWVWPTEAPGRRRRTALPLPPSAAGLPGADSPLHCCSRPRRTRVLPGRCRNRLTSGRPCSVPGTCSGRHLGREGPAAVQAPGREPAAARWREQTPVFTKVLTWRVFEGVE